jgi:hypothetical protein
MEGLSVRIEGPQQMTLVLLDLLIVTIPRHAKPLLSMLDGSLTIRPAGEVAKSAQPGQK